MALIEKERDPEIWDEDMWLDVLVNLSRFPLNPLGYGRDLLSRLEVSTLRF